MNIKDSVKYKDYPEGSGGKKFYDYFHLSFADYLNKYYLDNDLSRWKYINQKFVQPIFNGTPWNEYLIFLDKAKPVFFPNKDKFEHFMSLIEKDKRFDSELKTFFAFLYSIDFFKDLSFEEWLNVNYWAHPWNPKESKGRSILDLLFYKNSNNYLKEKLSQLSIF